MTSSKVNMALRALLATLLVCAATVPFALSLNTVGVTNNADATRMERRFLANATELDACKAIASLDKKNKDSRVYYPLSIQYGQGKHHYMTSSEQNSACVYWPTTGEDLAAGLKVVGDKRVRFAVSSGGHASNPGWSSTKGVHITLRGFTDVAISSDRSYIDVGGGSKWDEVYKKLDGSGLNVVGGRVPGVGIGGFITGGGGYSWKSNQWGLTADTLIQADMVLPDGTLTTASESENSDLFWAIRGGGNQFGVIYNYRLKAVPQPDNIYGGVRLYTADQVPALLDATYDFSENNKDPKAQIITTLNNIGILGGGAILLAIYDGDPGNTKPFGMFDKIPYQVLLGNFKTQSFNSAISSVPSQLQGGHRGAFHSVMFERYSRPIIEQIYNQTKFYGKAQLLHSGSLVSYDIEPFVDFRDKTKDAAWPHQNGALPLNLYYAWDNPADDKFWLDAIKESARVLTDQARAEGQKVDELWLYPNYLVADTPSSQIFGPNLGRLAELKRKFDPKGIMRLATYFPF